MDGDETKEEDRINIDGPSQESIFYQLRTFYLHSPDIDDLISRISSELHHIQSFRDERLLVLVGTLVAENAIDTVLTASCLGSRRSETRGMLLFLFELKY